MTHTSDIAMNIRRETKALITAVREFEERNELKSKPMPEKSRIELYEGTVIRIAENIILKNSAWATDLPEHYFWDLCRECKWLGDILALDPDDRNAEMDTLVELFYEQAIEPIMSMLEKQLSVLELKTNPWRVVGLVHPTFGMLVFRQLGDFRIHAWEQSVRDEQPARSHVSVAAELPTAPGEYYLCRLTASIQHAV